MKTAVIFIVFFAAFVLGLLLMTTGTAAASVVDCPALTHQFPAAEPRCNLFAGLFLAGGPMMVVGGAVFSWTLAFGKWRD